MPGRVTRKLLEAAAAPSTTNAGKVLTQLRLAHVMLLTVPESFSAAAAATQASEEEASGRSKGGLRILCEDIGTDGQLLFDKINDTADKRR